MIVVTHEIGFAREVADTGRLHGRRPIVEQGPPASSARRPAARTHPRLPLQGPLTTRHVTHARSTTVTTLAAPPRRPRRRSDSPPPSSSPPAATAATAARPRSRPRPGSRAKINIGPDQNRITRQEVDAIAAKVPGEDPQARHAGRPRRQRRRRAAAAFYATDDKTVIGVELDLATWSPTSSGSSPTSRRSPGRTSSSAWTAPSSTPASPMSRSPRSARRSTTSPPTGWTTSPSRRRRAAAWRSTGRRTWRARPSPSAPAPTRRRSWSTGTRRTRRPAASRWTSSTTRTTTDYYLALQSGRIDALPRPQPDRRLPRRHRRARPRSSARSPAAATWSRARSRPPPRRTAGWSTRRRRDQPHHRERHVRPGAEALGALPARP